MILTDCARFNVSDPDAVVAASFSCPYCLDLPTSAAFVLDEPYESGVLCVCDPCVAGWVVTVDMGQAMRLAIAPPDALGLEAA